MVETDLSRFFLTWIITVRGAGEEPLCPDRGGHSQPMTGDDDGGGLIEACLLKGAQSLFCQLLPRRGEQQALDDEVGSPRMLLDHIDDTVQHRSKGLLPVRWVLLALLVKGDRGSDQADQIIAHTFEQLGLVIEMPVERHRRGAKGGCEFAGGELLWALGVDELQGSRDQSLPAEPISSHNHMLLYKVNVLSTVQIDSRKDRP